MTALTAALLATAAPSSAASQTAPADAAPGVSYGLAMHGAPALPEDFEHFLYANPDAPQGGAVRVGVVGAFDTVSPFQLRGQAAAGVRAHVFESLMARNRDEPFALYGLLAEHVWTAPDRSWVEFQLRENARFANGEPVTVEDVIWSLETLGELGRRSHRTYYPQVAAIERPGPRRVRFVFAEPNRELPLLIGLMPVLPRGQWDGRDFEAATFEPLIGSGPYRLVEIDPGRRVVFERNPDYWGADLPANRGRNNFDQIAYVYFRGEDTHWEAFKAGDVDLFFDGDPERWATQYDFPAARDGRVTQSEIGHGLPSGMHGFVFNTRRAPFDDPKLRQALALVFDFDRLNQAFFRGGYRRIESFFSGSELGFENPASPEERALLSPYADHLPEGALEDAWRPDANEAERRRWRAARRLLTEAGWRAENGVYVDSEGRPLALEILVRTQFEQRLALAFVEDLKRFGVRAEMRLVDSSRYLERRDSYDYDMIVARWWLSLSPGEEQRIYWSSPTVDQRGARNYMGVANPAVDAMIDALLAAEARGPFVTAVRALDRALSAHAFAIPFGYLTSHRIGHWATLAHPERDALYGYQFDVWWRATE